jgi:tetratricopeptide (TPR) repeat protein
MATVQDALAAALAHHQAGRLPEAEGIYRQILDVEPQHAETLHLLGVLAHQVGQNDASVALIGQAIAIDGGNRRYHNNLGTAYRMLKRFDDAAASYRRALALFPDFAEAHGNLGIVLAEQGDHEAADASYRRALALSPGFAEAHYNLGNSLRARHRMAAAIDAYRTALMIEPRFPDALGNLGALLFEQGETAAAIDHYRQAIALAPANPVTHNNLGNALIAQDQVSEAVDSYRRALALDRAYVPAHINLGNALQEAGDLEGATRSYAEALALDPDAAEADWGLALIALLTGDFAAGWPRHEARHRVAGFGVPRRFVQPQWRGEPLDGRTILLHAEQGLGDTLQFVRYVPLVAARGGRVVLEVPRELYGLLGAMPGAARVVSAGDPLPDVDVHCPLLSLPLAFGTDRATIPASVPYLAADPAKVAAWNARLPSETIRVGLVWAGRPEHKRDRWRSLTLAALAPLVRAGVAFVSLQKGPAAGQAKTPPPGMVLLDPTDELVDFTDTAALVAALDLVVAVDTSVAHLAGALGKPVWILLPAMPDWRWLSSGDESPWYPTARLFRQPSRGDWRTVAETVGRDLEAYVGHSVRLPG